MKRVWCCSKIFGAAEMKMKISRTDTTAATQLAAVVTSSSCKWGRQVSTIISKIRHFCFRISNSFNGTRSSSREFCWSPTVRKKGMLRTLQACCPSAYVNHYNWGNVHVQLAKLLQGILAKQFDSWQADPPVSARNETNKCCKSSEHHSNLLSWYPTKNSNKQ